MGRDYYVRMEDAIILKHFDNRGTPDIKAIQAELKENGYERTIGSIRTHVSNLRKKGKAPQANYTHNPDKVVCVETGEVFKSVNAAKRHIGIKSYDAMVKALTCSNRTAGGYHWRYGTVVV